MLELTGAAVTFMIFCTTISALWSLFKWLCLRSSYQFGKLIGGLLYGVPKAIFNAFKYAFVPLHSRIQKVQTEETTTYHRDDHTVTFDGSTGRDIVDLNQKRQEKQVLEGEFLENPVKRVNQKR